MNAPFELLDGDAEIVPGVRVITTPGHTSGHQSVLVTGQDGSVDVLIGDAAYTTVQFGGPADRGASARAGGRPGRLARIHWAGSRHRIRPGCTSVTTPRSCTAELAVTALMRSKRYEADVLAAAPRPRQRPLPRVELEHGLVVEDRAGEFCGAVVGWEKDAVLLEDRYGKRRAFPLRPGAFLLEGNPVTLVRPAPQAPAGTARTGRPRGGQHQVGCRPGQPG